MKAEDYFRSVLLSYKRQLSKCGSSVTTPRLRAYCKSHHVSYRSFLRWTSTQAISCGLPEIERNRKRLKIASSTGVDEVCSIPSCPSDIGDKPLLYPLHIISDTSEHQAEPVVPSFDSALSPACGHTGQSVLRDIRITFPGGIKIWIREADSRGIYSLVHSIVNPK